MFIEKFIFKNYSDLMDLLNLESSTCEYKVEDDRILIGTKANLIYDRENQKLINKPKTIYAFYDFDLKAYELRNVDGKNGSTYINIEINPSIKAKYIKYMKKNFGAKYETALVEKSFEK